MLALSDAEERAEFIRHVRIEQSEGIITMERGPVRDLLLLLERRENGRYEESAAIAELRAAGALEASSLRIVSPQVLDELARLEEVLRLNRSV
jgi:hypothetical protein